MPSPVLGNWQSVVADALGGLGIDLVLRIVCVREGVAMIYTDEHRPRRLPRTNDWRAQFI